MSETAPLRSLRSQRYILASKINGARNSLSQAERQLIEMEHDFEQIDAAIKALEQAAVAMGCEPV